MNYTTYNKNSGNRPFHLILTAAIYLRLTGDEPTALMSHMSIQDSRLQRTYLLQNSNDCIDRKAKSCSPLTEYAEKWSFLCICIFLKKVNLQLRNDPRRSKRTPQLYPSPVMCCLYSRSQNNRLWFIASHRYLSSYRGHHCSHSWYFSSVFHIPVLIILTILNPGLGGKPLSPPMLRK